MKKKFFTIILVFFPIKFFLTVFLLFIASTQTFAQTSSLNFKFQGLGMGQGLSSDSIHAIIEDAHGFIWIGTENGLCRWDGYRFKIFKTILGDSQSVSENFITSLFIDHKKRIWVGTYQNGVCLYDETYETFKRFPTDSFLTNKLAPGYVNSFYQDDKERLWICSWGGGLNLLLDEKEGTFKRYLHDEKNPFSISTNQAKVLLQDHQGRYWFGGWSSDNTDTSGLSLFDPDTEKFYNLGTNRLIWVKEQPQAGLKFLHTMVVDRLNRLWCGGFLGLSCFDLNSGTFSYYTDNFQSTKSFVKIIVRSLYLDEKDNLWIGTLGVGIFILNLTSNEITHITHNAEDDQSLSSNFIKCIKPVSTGIIFGSVGGGLNILRKNENLFNLIPNNKLNAKTEYTELVGGITCMRMQAERKILLGGGYGMSLFDIRTDASEALLSNFHKLNKGNVKASAFIKNEKYGLVAATTWKSFLRLDNNYNIQQEWKGSFDKNHASNTFGLTDCIWLDNKYYYSVSGYSVGTYNPETGENVLAIKGKENGLCIMRDNTGKIWNGNIECLNIYDKNLNLLNRFNPEENNDKTISGAYLQSIIQDHAGIIYIATNKGLNIYENGSTAFKRLDARNGLAENTVNGVFEDLDNNLWISGINSICVMKPDRHTILKFNRADGFNFCILGSKFIQDTFSSLIYFNSDEGLWQVSPSGLDLYLNPPPPAVLSGLDIGHKEFITDSAIFLKKFISLTYDQNNLTFKFGYPQKTSTSEIFVRVSGAENDWKLLQDNGQLEYNYIKPGNYVLEIMVQDKVSGLETIKRLLFFRIMPPWWETGIFYIIVVLFLLGCIWVYTRLRTRNLKEQNKKLELKVQKRTQQLQIEKKKSDDLLLNILPSEVAEELKEKGTTEAKQFDHVTVLFTDFINFTGISQQMTPKELVKEIHQNFTSFDYIIEKYGLEKIKTIGDAYLAVCGLPAEVADHAQRVVEAALSIQSNMSTQGGKFQIRIGVHSGPVVAGIVGIKKYAYDIWGDTVNTAARMEQNSEAGKINISESTYNLIKDKFECEYRGEIEAKNKGFLKMYFVSGRFNMD